MAEVVLHEVLDGPASSTILVAHALCHLDLHIERKLINGATSDEVKVVSDRHQKGLRGNEVVEAMRKQSADATFGFVQSDVSLIRNVDKVCADYGDEPAINLYAKLGLREEVLHLDIPVGYRAK